MEAAAGFFGNAFQLSGSRLRFGTFQTKTDGMHGQVHAQFFQRSHGGTWIGVTGFLTVGNQDHGGLVLGEAKLLGSLLHGGRHWRHAFGIQAHHGRADGIAIGADRGQHFDIVAVALAVMPVSHQTQALVVRQVIEKVGNHIAGDDDLVGAIDLAPHGTRGVEDQDCIGLTRIVLRQCRAAKSQHGAED